MVNLILNRPSLNELIQQNLTTAAITEELRLITSTGARARETQLKDYEELHAKLGGVGASKRTAQLIVSYLNN